MGHYRGHVWELAPWRSLGVVTARDRVLESAPGGDGGQLKYWALDYCYSGGARFCVSAARDKWFTRTAGSYRLYAPGVELREDFSQAEFPRRSVYLVFAADGLGGAEELVRDYGVACFDDESGGLLRLMLEIVEVGERRGDAGGWEALSKLCAIIDLLGSMRHLVDENFVVPGKGESAAVRAAMELIERNVAGTLSLGGLAARLRLSPSTLSHRFAKETGMSPIAYRSSLRVERAKRMLKLGDPMKLIAEQLGYCDIYHFSKNFKALAGMTPTEFRGN